MKKLSSICLIIFFSYHIHNSIEFLTKAINGATKTLTKSIFELLHGMKPILKTNINHTLYCQFFRPLRATLEIPNIINIVIKNKKELKLGHFKT